jgi:hypothetical protein
MDNRQLACKIADHLFTNGSGKHAQRLVLELPGLKDGGGWCESAVVDVIDDALKSDLSALVAERDALKAAYHRLWQKHGDLAEQTVDEVIAAAPVRVETH